MGDEDVPPEGPDEPDAAPPGRASASPPPDPFQPMYAGYVQVLELFRGLRLAGAGLVEAALLTGGIIATNGPAGNDTGTAGE